MANSASTQRRTLMPKQRRAIKLQQLEIDEPLLVVLLHPPPTPPPPPAQPELLAALVVDEVELKPLLLALYVTMPLARKPFPVCSMPDEGGGSSIVRSVMLWVCVCVWAGGVA